MQQIFHNDNRAILSLEGDDPIGFLQDILTADIAGLGANHMRQSCLLSPQGRILTEMTIYITGENHLYIACDKDQRADFIKKLKLYRLRRKITIEARDDLTLITSFDKDLAYNTILTCQDERAPDMGTHCVIATSDIEAITFAPRHLYEARRIANAIPQGAEDLTPGRALMLEAGLDLFAAVDFKKGCYIGQEVTARTRYRGLVKRRLVPVIGANLDPDAPLIQEGKEVGTLLSHAPLQDQMIALASLRLTAIHKSEAGTSLWHNDSEITLAIPHHIRTLPIPEAKQ